MSNHWYWCSISYSLLFHHFFVKKKKAFIFIKNEKKILKVHAKKNLCFCAFVRRYSTFEVIQNKLMDQWFLVYIYILNFSWKSFHKNLCYEKFCNIHITRQPRGSKWFPRYVFMVPSWKYTHSNQSQVVQVLSCKKWCHYLLIDSVAQLIRDDSLSIEWLGS